MNTFMTRALERLTGKVTGAHILHSLPRGVDVYHDLARDLPNHTVGVVFDVGANIGQSVAAYRHAFPGARIVCFEPVGATFAHLRNTFAGDGRVQCHRMALGAEKGAAVMLLEGGNTMYRITDRRDSRGSPLEEVEVNTIDAFCEEHRYSGIGFLKIDTEGYDLEVLRGAESMLRGQAIDILQVEAAMNGRNDRHVPFERFPRFLEPMGYFLFGVYEQVPEWPTREPTLRRANLVFLSTTVIESNRGAGGADAPGLS